ncbi:unnamed protein product [Scytosiphon promiscuus]
MNQELPSPAIGGGGGNQVGDSPSSAHIGKEHAHGASSATTSGATASTSPADSRSNSERGSPDPATTQQQLSRDFDRASPPPTRTAEQNASTSTPASEIDGLFDASSSSSPAGSMDDSGYGSSTALAMDEDASRGGGVGIDGGDPDESFDMLANMPPTPGGLVPPTHARGDEGSDNDDNGDLEESFADMLGIRYSSPTTPAAVTVEQQGLRRSPRLLAASAVVSSRVNPSGLLSGSVGKGRRAGLPGPAAAAGGGGTVGGDYGVTPRSTRRTGRRENGQGFPERAATPGTAFGGDGDGDDANASFRTAIMGSVDGSAGDPGSVLRGANLFSNGTDADNLSEPMTPLVDAGDAETEEHDLSTTPSFDMSLTSVEKRVAGLNLTGDPVTASASPMDGADAAPVDVIGQADVGSCDGDTPGAAAVADVSEVVLPPPPPSSGEEAVAAAASSAAAADEEEADADSAAAEDQQQEQEQQPRWLEPPSPAVAAPSPSSTPAPGATSSGGTGGSSTPRASGRRSATFSPKEVAAAARSPGGGVSPYEARGRFGGGMSTSSTFGPSSDDQEDFLNAAYAARAGVGASSAETEVKLPAALPRADGARSSERRRRRKAAAAAAASAAAAAGGDGGGGDNAADIRDVAGGIGGGGAESGTVLEEMLMAVDPRGGTAEEDDEAAAAAAAAAPVSDGAAAAGGASAANAETVMAAASSDGGEAAERKGGSRPLSLVEKEAMAMAAACVAEQEALARAPEHEEAATATATAAAAAPPAEADVATGAASLAAPAAAVGAEDAAGPHEGGNQEPEIAGEESGDVDDAGGGDDDDGGGAPSAAKARAGSAGRGRKPAGTPGKPASPAAASTAAANGGMKDSRVPISRVAVPAAVSARRGSFGGGDGSGNGSSRRGSIVRPASPSRGSSSLRPPSPSPSKVGVARPASPARGATGARPPSPSPSRGSVARPASPARGGSGARPPSPSPARGSVARPASPSRSGSSVRPPSPSPSKGGSVARPASPARGATGARPPSPSPSRGSVARPASPARGSSARPRPASPAPRGSDVRPPSPSPSRGNSGSGSGGTARPASPARGSSNARPASPSRRGSMLRPPSPVRGTRGTRPPSPSPSVSAAARRPSTAFGSRVAAGAAPAPAPSAKAPVGSEGRPAAATAAVKRAPSRGRERSVRERASTGGFSRGRSPAGVGGGTAAAAPGVTPAAAPAPAAAVVAPVNPTSRLLAPTKVSQGRARPRSASPAVSSARGRASMGSFGGGPGESRPDSTFPGSPLVSDREMCRFFVFFFLWYQRRAPVAARQSHRLAKKKALTIAKAPNFSTSHRSKTEKATQETSEEAELRLQRVKQEEMRQLTRRNQAAMERSRRNAFSGNVRSSKPLTVPESPAMKMTGRLGGKVYAAVGAQDQPGFSPTHPAKDDMLSKDGLAHASAQPRGPTIPTPFQLSTSNRAGRDGVGSAPGTPRSKEGSMTFRESLAHLENKTPDRFRTRRAGEQPNLAPAARVDPKPTLPQSPRFRTEIRAAGHAKSHVLSREEREEAELAEMKKNQFKARPYNPDGFGVGGEQGVFRPQHSDKQLTQPTPFHLSSDERASRRAPSPHRSRDEEELSKKFKARPLPGGRSSSVGRVRPGAKVGGELKPRELTVAASPNLSTKRRSALRSNSLGGAGAGAGAGVPTSEEAELEKAAANKFKALPMPNYSKLAQPRRRSMAPAKPAPEPTEPRPFKLLSDERGKVKQASLAQRMLDQRRQEQRLARVRARPLPAPSNGFCPQPSDRPLTETREFSLSSQARHEKAEHEFRERVRQEEERARRSRRISKVIALPLPAATFEPELYPERTEKTLTQPVEVVMHSSARAEGRAKWEEENQARLEEEQRRK